MIRPLFFVLAAALGLALTGCATTSGTSSAYPGETLRGTCSWYGYENGRATASGERLDGGKLTAAHRRLPFGTIVRVTNKLNGRSVEVRINDRGPWTGGRVLDVTSAAADALDMKRAGIVPVEIVVLEVGSGKRSNG